MYILLDSYTDIIGLRLIREDVAKYISRRDGYPADVDDVILTDGGAIGIKVRDQYSFYWVAVNLPIKVVCLLSCISQVQKRDESEIWLKRKMWFGQVCHCCL